MDYNPLQIVRCDGTYVSWRRSDYTPLMHSTRNDLDVALGKFRDPEFAANSVRLGKYLCDENDLVALRAKFEQVRA